MAKTKVLTAPYHPDGSLLHYPRDFHQFSHYEVIGTGERLEREQIWERLNPPIVDQHGYTQIERQIRTDWKVVYRQPEWRMNQPWRASLQLDTVTSGRSAKYVIWRPVNLPLDRRTFPMFVTDLLDVVKNGEIQPGGIVSARWMVAKRGQNYGLRLAKEEE